jgi:large subunit ribosomal protein L25
METVELQVSARNVGKGAARGIRDERHTPAVAYSKGQENLTFSVDDRMLDKYAGAGKGYTIFQLKSDDSKINGKTAIVKSTSRHPVSLKYMSADFQLLESGKTFKTDIEIIFQGTPAGVKEGGTFQPTRRTVKVETTPEKLPKYLTMDVSAMNLKDSRQASMLEMPEGVKLITRGEITICTCAK